MLTSTGLEKITDAKWFRPRLTLCCTGKWGKPGSTLTEENPKDRREPFVALISCVCCGLGGLGHNDDPYAHRSGNAHVSLYSSDFSSCTSQNDQNALVSGSGNVMSSCCGTSLVCVSNICSPLTFCNSSF